MFDYRTQRRFLIGYTLIALVALGTAVFAEDRLYRHIGFFTFVPLVLAVVIQRLRDAWRAERYRRQRRIAEISTSIQQLLLVALLASSIFDFGVLSTSPVFAYVAFGLFLGASLVTIVAQSQASEQLKKDGAAAHAKIEEERNR